jgi:hypothetical protein
VPPLAYDRHLFLERDLRTVTSNTRRDREELLWLAGRLGVRVHVHLYAFDDAASVLSDPPTNRFQRLCQVARPEGPSAPGPNATVLTTRPGAA